MSGMRKDEIPCRLCAQYSFSEVEMKEQIDAYLRSLPSDLLVPTPVYQARLDACGICAHQAQGMCRLCGCYVRTRAAKKTTVCPDVGRERWHALPL